MMEFNGFCEYIKDHVKEYLPDSFQDADVTIGQMQKNNGTQLMGLSIRTKGCTISPNIYLDNYYREYQDGMDPDLVCERIAHVHIEHMDPSQALTEVVDKFQDPEYIKSRVVISLVNAEKNAKLLREIPHRLKEDLAIIYKVYLGNTGENIGTVTVKNEHMKAWNLSEAELYSCAMKNSRELLPVEVKDMGSILASMGFPVDEMISDGPMLYVISNKNKCNGAAGILYSDCLEKLSDKLGSDLYILPSSIHETIALKADGDKQVEELAKMVREINATQVSPEEQLSDHVYRYSAGERTLSLADVRAEDLKVSMVSEKNASYEPANTESVRCRRHR